LIKADPSPIKTAPENPGGMQVPNQDKEVFERLASGGKAPAAKAPVETLLPPPEQPVAQPPPPPAPPPVAAPPPLTAPTTGPVANLPMPPVPPPLPVGAIPPRNTMTAPTDTAAAQPATAAPPPAVTDVPPAPPPSALPPLKTPAATAPPPPAPQPAAGGGYRVQLGAVKSEAEADKEWRRVKGRYADVLARVGVRYQRADLGEKGVWYRVQAGPYADKAAAEAVCARLKSGGQGCSLVQ
jgi:hypothetical protein